MAKVFNSKGIVKSATSHEGEPDPIITPQMNSLFRDVHPGILKAVIQLVTENSLESSEQSLSEEQKKLLEAEERKKLLEGSSNIANERKIIKEQKKRRKFSAGKIEYNEDGSPNFDNSSYDREDDIADIGYIGDIEDTRDDFDSQGHTVWDDLDDNEITNPPPTNTIFVDPTYVSDNVLTNKVHKTKDCDQCMGLINKTIDRKEKEKLKKSLEITGNCRCGDTGSVCNQCSNNLVIGQKCPSCLLAGTALPGEDTPLGSIEEITQPLPNVLWNTPDFAYTDEMLTRQAPTSNISAADTRVSDNSARAQAAFGTLLWDDSTYEPDKTEQDLPSGEPPEKRPNPNVKDHNSPIGRADRGWTDTSSGKPMIKKQIIIQQPEKEKHDSKCICGGTGRIDRVDSNQARELIKKIKFDQENLNRLVEINSEENEIERSRQLEELYANIYACPHNKTNNSVEKVIVSPTLEYIPNDDDEDDDNDDEDMDEE